MRYHNITKDDMLNGDGLRVVLWLAGCEHHCKNCQNPVTWDPDGGLPFDEAAKAEIYEELDKEYVSGITFSGGDPLLLRNREELTEFLKEIKKNYPEKIVLAYTASQYDPSYNSYIQKADDVLQKSLSTESWLENLDKYLYMISDPIFQWKKFRNQLLEKDVSLITVARYEDIFVKSYKKGDFKDFKNLEASVDGDIKNIFSKFISTILVELIKAI